MRFLLKLSGELFGSLREGDFNRIENVCFEITQAQREQSDLEISIVLGGGNLWRGRDKRIEDELISNNIGSSATIINALLLSSIMNKHEIKNKLVSAIPFDIMDQYRPDNARALMSNGYIVIIACGLGIPFFTSDTAAAVRGKELEVDRILKATNVDGVFPDDILNANAEILPHTTFSDLLSKSSTIIDLTAAAFCKTHSMEMNVYNGFVDGNTYRVLRGHNIGTLITNLY